MDRITRRTPELVLVAAGLLATGPVLAATLSLEVSNLRSAQGRVMIALCGNATAAIPGDCSTYRAMAAAQQGMVTIRVENIQPGRYAIQAFHDENGNLRPDIPGEGFAFGNDAPWPPSFDAAAVQVDGDTRTRLAMSYFGTSATAGTAQTAPQTAAVASQGAPAPQGVTRKDLRANGLYGEFYAPDAGGSAPGLLLIGGSEGGIDTISQMATSFAAAGYPTLALAYWNAPGLPRSLENIPLEYFDRAIDWLQQQPQVAHGSIGMLGWSRGAEAALLVAARNPSIKVLVAVAPSSVVWQGLNIGAPQPWQPAWTVGGKALPSVVPDASHYRADQPMAQMFTASFEVVDQRVDAAIAVEQIRGSLLLISGGADALWPSTRFADRIVARLQALGFKGDVLHLDYPDAGHALFVGDPDGPMAREFGGSNAIMGGTPQANAQARADSWRRTLAFLQQHLGNQR